MVEIIKSSLKLWLWLSCEFPVTCGRFRTQSPVNPPVNPPVNLAVIAGVISAATCPDSVTRFHFPSSAFLLLFSIYTQINICTVSGGTGTRMDGGGGGGEELERITKQKYAAMAFSGSRADEIKEWRRPFPIYFRLSGFTPAISISPPPMTGRGGAQGGGCDPGHPPPPPSPPPTHTPLPPLNSKLNHFHYCFNYCVFIHICWGYSSGCGCQFRTLQRCQRYRFRGS